MPKVVPSVIVLATLELGRQPDAGHLRAQLSQARGAAADPDWGTVLNDGRAFFQRAPQLMIYPGLAITLAVIGSNLVGDGLRDVLDPRMKR